MSSNASTLSTSPFLPMLAQLSQLPVIYLCSFTHSRSPLRYLAIPINAFLAYICQIHLPNLNNGYWAANFGAMSFLSIAMTFERLIVGKWSWEVGGPEAWRTTISEERKRSAAKLDNGRHKNKKAVPPSKNMTMPPRKTYLNYGIDLVFNSRGVSRPWEVPSLPPAYTPHDTLPRFLLSRSFAFLTCFSLTLYAAYQPSPPSHLLTPSHLYTLSRLPSSSVTMEEISFKFLSMLGFLFGIYTTITYYTAFHALFFVGTGLSDFRSWRRNYNSPVEAYTLRRFWSPFWHQYLRNSLQGNADWVVENWIPGFLLMGGDRLVRRYTRLLLAFSISGIIHIGGDIGTGIPLRESGALRFFVMQALGVMGEDAVMECWSRVAGNPSSSSSSSSTSSEKVGAGATSGEEVVVKGKENGTKQHNVEDHGRKRQAGKPPALWIRCLGYLWVLAFMTVTVPTWSFPYLRRHVPGAAPAFKLEWLGLV